jgi:hypothetical protein
MGRNIAKKYTHFTFSDRRFLHFNENRVRINIVGELDVIADGTAIEIKTTQKFTLEHMVQTYLYACILHQIPRVAWLVNTCHGHQRKLVFSEDGDVHAKFASMLIADVAMES